MQGRARGSLPSKETAAEYVTVGSNGRSQQGDGRCVDGHDNLLAEKRKLDRLDAYGLASVAMDCRIAPPAGSEVGVHCLVPKNLWRTQARAQ